jgi:hypothetical protein
MSAGAVRKSMTHFELMCWAHWLNEAHREVREQIERDNQPPAPLELDVDAEIAAWPM